ncbi:MAG: aldehyde dehydrogenase (NADP(+)) [Anaerolineae bacterium]|nr:aldehyde dehydrogenase (NADP(+)) [Anaerolineae bacterium]
MHRLSRTPARRHSLIITGKHLIAGEWTQANAPTFASVNPRTKLPGANVFAEASADEIDRAVEAAAAAFTETRNYAPEQRAQFLEAVAAEIEALGDELLQVCDAETGLGLPRLTGERGRTTGQLRAFAEHVREGSYVEAIIDTALPERQPAPRPDIRRMLIPIGPVAVFSPNNFPLAFSVAGGDSASAFAAGCPVIVKGHPSHPATSELVAGAIACAVEQCGFPAGFFSLLQGAGVEVGQALVKHPRLAAVGFTGSFRGGRAIFDTAAARPKPIPVYAEMGSVNPVVILPDAVATKGDGLVSAIAGSVTLGSGQFCTNPGLIFMVDSEASSVFVGDVAKAMAAQAPGVLLNAGVEATLDRQVSRTLGKAAVTLVTGGAVAHSDGFCYANTVMQTTGAAFLDDPGLTDEHFGPVTLFVMCESLDQIKTIITRLDGNLTATVHASDAELATAGDLFDLLREICGRLILNGVPTGVEVVHAMVHGGPYPATSAPNSTSVGRTAIQRFLRPVAYQNLPDALLPDALKDANPLGIWRIVDNAHTRDAIG